MSARNLLFLYAFALFVTYLAMQAGNMLYASMPSFSLYAPAHFMGGFSVGVFVLLASKTLDIKSRLLYCVAAILIIGTAWEIWEYVLGLSEYPADTIDTISDYVMDMLGAFTAYGLFVKKMGA